ncbi:MAG TPA: chemotaxis protein CheB [Tabrizicola sp.]|jgi:two-component system, chemotaxis family, protein-glutamate methylesterase/glutaminase
MEDLEILVVSGSPVQRGRMTRMLENLPGVTVIATAGNLSETFNIAEARDPHLVVLGDEFRLHEDFVAIKSLFYALGARWLFFDTSDPIKQRGLPKSTVQVVSEPVLNGNMDSETALLVIRRVMALQRAGEVARTAGRRSSVSDDNWLVAIGASTGGVDALLNLLSEFPEDCPPTAIVQHTGRGFSDSLVRMLDRRCRPKVLAAEDGVVLRRGTICIAAGAPGHFVLGQGSVPMCQIRPGELIAGHMPSCNALFRSMLPVASRVIGVLLTGMGQDGAAGLLDLRRAGAVTIGQDQASSVVYGMPKVAWEIGAVQTQLPIDRIAPEILRIAARPPGKSRPLAFASAP